jgi:predicted ATPase with chaperone activity
MTIWNRAGMPVPATIGETGLSRDLVLQIAVKTVYFAGELTGSELADRLGVRFEVIEPVLDLLRRDRHCEISGSASIGAPSYRYRLTDAGRVRAAFFLEESRYIGPLPVPLAQYTRYMRERAGQAPAWVTPESVAAAFSHLVLNRRVLDQLGPALAARHSLFIYGPSGNGKTVIAKAIGSMVASEMLVPHAVEVEGHIIRVFDPVNHTRISPPADQNGLEREADNDRRWVLCQRPLVMVGGELTLDACNLAYAPGSGFYRAPLQMVANGGVLVIDDFGRQHSSARDILNRWIVPLEARIDHLRLQTGQSFEVPFDVFVVFATNLKPSELIDEAFLRRIQYKVRAESPTPQEFIDIFQDYCRRKAIPSDPALAADVAEDLRTRGIPLRACHPRDLIERALAVATYFGRPRALTRELLADASATYFLTDRELEEV